LDPDLKRWWWTCSLWLPTCSLYSWKKETLFAVKKHVGLASAMSARRFQAALDILPKQKNLTPSAHRMPSRLLVSSCSAAMPSVLLLERCLHPVFVPSCPDSDPWQRGSRTTPVARAPPAALWFFCIANSGGGMHALAVA
jgi:hypothetical protein